MYLYILNCRIKDGSAYMVPIQNILYFLVTVLGQSVTRFSTIQETTTNPAYPKDRVIFGSVTSIFGER